MKKIKKVKKHMSFPEPLYNMIMEKGALYGQSFAQRVMHVLVEDVEKSNDFPLMKISPKEEAEIVKGLEDFEKGRIVKVRNHKELDDLYRTL